MQSGVLESVRSCLNYVVLGVLEHHLFINKNIQVGIKCDHVEQVNQKVHHWVMLHCYVWPETIGDAIPGHSPRSSTHCWNVDVACEEKCVWA